MRYKTSIIITNYYIIGQQHLNLRCQNAISGVVAIAIFYRSFYGKNYRQKISALRQGSGPEGGFSGIHFL